MKKARKTLYKLLSGLSLAAFFVCAGIQIQPMKVYAQANETEEEDYSKPTVNGAISNQKLVVEAYDESGIKAIYINDYEFLDVPEGRLSIRLQQFDAGYEYFTVTALDNAGNLSDEYLIQNPYFEKEENYASELPSDASPSGETEAKADVTEYTEVKGDDGSVKVFYTFETENGKVFYLIINRTQNGEEVHFLTDVSENDLLNTTSDNSEVLPKNSAALSSGLPVTQEPKIEEPLEPEEETTEEVETETQVPEPEEPVNEDKPMGTYIVLGIVGAIAIGVAYYFKVVRKKEEFLDEEDDEDDDFEELEEIEDFEEEKDDFFKEDTEGEKDSNE